MPFCLEIGCVHNIIHILWDCRWPSGLTSIRTSKDRRPPSLRDYVRQTRREQPPLPSPRPSYQTIITLKTPLLFLIVGRIKGCLLCHRCPWCAGRDVFIIIILHNSDTEQHCSVFDGCSILR